MGKYINLPSASLRCLPAYQRAVKTSGPSACSTRKLVVAAILRVSCVLVLAEQQNWHIFSFLHRYSPDLYRASEKHLAEENALSKLAEPGT